MVTRAYVSQSRESSETTEDLFVFAEMLIGERELDTASRRVRETGAFYAESNRDDRTIRPAGHFSTSAQPAAVQIAPGEGREWW